MMNWDDELVASYVDGELHTLIEARLEEAMESDDELRARVERQRSLSKRLRARFDPVLQDQVPERLLSPLAQSPSENVVPIAAGRRRRGLMQRAWVPAAMAASLAVGVFGGHLLGSDRGVAEILMARGDLADVLDSQLAAAPPAEAKTRIGTTFRDAENRVCRTFDGDQVAGFACREQGGWKIEMLAPGSGRAGPGYRQASSGAMLVLQAAQEQMAGEPLNEADERRLREANWR